MKRVRSPPRFRRSGKASRKQNEHEFLPIRRFREAGLHTNFTQMPFEIGRHHRMHMMTGRAGTRCLIFRSVSAPSMPGIITSHNTHPRTDNRECPDHPNLTPL